MQRASFLVYDICVQVESNSAELITRITKDLAFFYTNSNIEKKHFRIFTSLEEIPAYKIPLESRGVRNRNSVSFHQGSVRFNDYYGQALSVYDFRNNTAEIYSPWIDRLHEVTYLLILSRVGKELEKKGIHRMHAMGLSLNQKIILCLMPMGGGKTTLFLDLLKCLNAKIISDDSPLITRRGMVLPFPLRIGIKPDMSERASVMEVVNWNQHYTLQRMRYGLKYLLPIVAVKRSVFQPENQPVYLLIGKRVNRKDCKIYRASALKAFPMVFLNLVIGVGLPMMREYFFENNFMDWVQVFRIFMSRIKIAARLIKFSKKYQIELGTDPEINAEVVARLVSVSPSKETI